MKPHGVNFHYFENENYIKCQGSIDERCFSSIIEYLNKKYNLLNASDFLKRVIDNAICENDICLTLDDGLKCQYDIALPILRKYGVTAFFFIYTSHFSGSPSNLEIFHDFRFSMFDDIDEFYNTFFEYVLKNKNLYETNIEKIIKEFDPTKYLIHSKCHTDTDRLFRYIRDCALTKQEYENIMFNLMKFYNYKPESNYDKLWLSENEIREISDSGNIIGLHSHSHPTSLLNKNYDEQFLEYSKNKNILSKITGKEISVASYPSGKFNNDTIQVMKNLNIKLAFCANMDEGDPRNALLFPRKNHTDLLIEMQKL